MTDQSHSPASQPERRDDAPLPCPSCASTDLLDEDIHKANGDFGFRYISCNCGMSGNIDAWNTRAPLPSAPAQCTRPRDFLAWAVEMFGPVAKLRSERLLRFVEEAIELAHAEGMEREVFNRVADRVYSRPAGDTPKEIGQTQACLETLAENIGLSSADEAEREWQRVQEIPQEERTRRHAAKQAIGIALLSTEGK